MEQLCSNAVFQYSLGIKMPQSHSVASAAGNHQIDFSIYDVQMFTANGNEPIKFSLINKNYWIVIESIRPIK